MAEQLLDDRTAYSSNIVYIPERRLYVIYTWPGRGHDRITIDEIYYCPWCGSKLPKSLSDEYFARLDALNVHTAKGQTLDRRRIPKEFRGDAWWKSRKL